jgi:hypothetical protein
MDRNRRAELFHERLNNSGFSSYKEYLGSSEWKEKKLEAKVCWGQKANKCSFCRDFMDVWHHKSYVRVGGNEGPKKDLIPLCNNCHQYLHWLASNANIRWITCKMRVQAGKLKSTQKGKTFLSPIQIRIRLRSKFNGWGRKWGRNMDLIPPVCSDIRREANPVAQIDKTEVV